MKFILLPLIALSTFTHLHAKEEDKKTPEDLTRLYYAQRSVYNYDSLVDHMHPRTLRRFKELTNRIIESLIKRESEAAVFEAFEGVNSLEELNELSEKNFWVYVMGTISSYSEEKEWKNEIQYISSVEDGDYLYALHRFSSDLDSTPEDEKLQSPRTITLKKDGDEWKYHSFQIRSVERYLEWHLRNQALTAY